MSLGTTAQIDFQLKHAGVPVVYGTQRGYGLLDLMTLNDRLETGMEIKGATHTLLVRDGAFTGLTARAPNNKITVNGVVYVILDLGYAATNGTRKMPVAVSV